EEKMRWKEREKRWKEREKTKMRWKAREKGNRNVIEREYKAKATRDRRRWENTTAVKIWRRESITKMRREKARDKIRCRAQTVKGKGECLSHYQLSPVELVRMSRCEVPVQPMRESFPKTLQGGARRSFRSDWYKSHPWLEYSHSKDAAYCFAFRLFFLPDAPRTVFTSFQGYRNWKEATMKDSGFCHLMPDLKEIIQEVKMSKQFSVIVDETKDVQKKEQMSFVLRYFYNGVVHESFLEFEVAEHLDAAALSGKIICFLEKHGLEYKKNLVVQREMFDGAPRELQQLGDTRWACRHIACGNVMDRLPAVVQVLEEIASENHPQRAVEARGILAQIDLNFAGSLVLFRKVLSDSNFLSDMLQSKTVDYAKAVELIEALKETLVQYRSQASFEEMWSDTLDLCQRSNIDTTQRKPKRPRQTTKVLQDTIIHSTLGQHVVPDSKHTFCVSVYYPVLDNMIGEIGRRFSNTNCNIIQGDQALNPSSPTFLREEAVLLLAEAYDSNIEDLKHELHQSRRVLDRKKGEKESPTTLMEFTQFLKPYEDVFYELFRLCKIAVVLPVSSASCEQIFSSLRLIKTYLRSTMTEKRLSSLTVLSIESKRTEALDLDTFVKRFAEQHGNRRIQLL
uniref:HAT C-terminal dimerisation domain-containing protein n=1 Tax=Dicentrarchus labrax TaxID=13489 RepID=A0A8C4F7V8_DICLA